MGFLFGPGGPESLAHVFLPFLSPSVHMDCSTGPVSSGSVSGLIRHELVPISRTVHTFSPNFFPSFFNLLKNPNPNPNSKPEQIHQIIIKLA